MNALRTIIVAVVCFALGAAAGRFYDRRLPGTPASAPPAAGATNHEIDYANEPLWAYGFETVRKPGEEAAPQNPPSRRLRPNEDATEQTRPQSVAGSRASYSLVDVRDNANVIDWFPADHPSPMPDIIAHGPAGL